MEKRDYYEVLGVPKTASEPELKRAYYKLARQFHPDVNKAADAEAKFKELSEAYAVLSDSEKRQRYDRFGHAGVGAGSSDFGGDPFAGFGGFSDIFEAFFGGAGAGSGRSQRRGPDRGADLKMELTLSFAEAYSGVEKTIEVHHQERCSSCSGSGAKAGTHSVTCALCHGVGQITQTQRTLFGQFSHMSVCPKCEGEGRTVENPCLDCRGIGRTKRGKRISVTVPAGVDNNMRLKVAGEGDVGQRGGPAGDLYLFITVAEDERFERQEHDLYTEAHVSFTQLALGDEIEISTMEEPQSLKIPPGTQTGVEFVIKGMGFPRLGDNRGRRGDMHVSLRLVVPTDLSDEEKDLLRRFDQVNRKRIEGSGHRLMDFLRGILH